MPKTTKKSESDAAPAPAAVVSNTLSSLKIREFNAEDCVRSPLNARTVPVSQDKITALAESIMQRGQLQPGIVHQIKEDGPSNGKWGVLVGGNRCEAVKLLNSMLAEGEKAYPFLAIVAEGEDAAQILRSAAENEYRVAPTIIDRAYAMSKLLDLGMTQKEIAQQFRRGDGTPLSEATVSQTLKVMNLSKKTQKMIAQGELPADVAYILAGVPKEEHDAIIEDAVKYREWLENTAGEIDAAAQEELDAANAPAPEPAAEGKPAKDAKEQPKPKDGRTGKVGKKGQKATTADVAKAAKAKGHKVDAEAGAVKSKKSFLALLDALYQMEDLSDGSKNLVSTLAQWWSGDKTDTQVRNSFLKNCK